MNVKDYIASLAAVKYLGEMKSTVDGDMQAVISDTISMLEAEMAQYKVVLTKKMANFNLDLLNVSELIRMTTLRVRTLALIDKDFAVRSERLLAELRINRTRDIMGNKGGIRK